MCSTPSDRSDLYHLMFADSDHVGTPASPQVLTGRKLAMTEKNSGPEEAIKGVVEGAKGKAKEVIGAVAGRDDPYREGQAQKEAEAEAARAAAKTAEKRQEAEQR